MQIKHRKESVRNEQRKAQKDCRGSKADRKCSGILEEVREDEQESYDNLPEGLQNSERGEQMRENMELLGEFIDNLEEADSLTDL